jgi:hypothetical protein
MNTVSQRQRGCIIAQGVVSGDGSKNCGPERTRTADLSDANRTLSQLSYRPMRLLPHSWEMGSTEHL